MPKHQRQEIGHDDLSRRRRNRTMPGFTGEHHGYHRQPEPAPDRHRILGGQFWRGRSGRGASERFSSPGAAGAGRQGIPDSPERRQAAGNSSSTRCSPAKRPSPSISRPTTSRTSSSGRRFRNSPGASGRSSASSEFRPDPARCRSPRRRAASTIAVRACCPQARLPGVFVSHDNRKRRTGLNMQWSFARRISRRS